MAPQPKKKAKASGRSFGYGETSEAILREVGKVLATAGPSAVQINDICTDLGVSPSLVNYHFGNRDRLLAEAVILEFGDLVAEMNRITYATTSSPEAQFRARVEYRLDWTASHPGIDSMINYSHVIDPVGEVLKGEMESKVGQLTASDLLGLHTCIYGLYSGTALNRPVSDTENMQCPALFDITGFVALSVLGLATWATGRHPADKTMMEEQPEVARHIRDTFMNRLVRYITSEIDQLQRA